MVVCSQARADVVGRGGAEGKGRRRHTCRRKQLFEIVVCEDACVRRKDSEDGTVSVRCGDNDVLAAEIVVLGESTSWDVSRGHSPSSRQKQLIEGGDAGLGTHPRLGAEFKIRVLAFKFSLQVPKAFGIPFHLSALPVLT